LLKAPTKSQLIYKAIPESNKTLMIWRWYDNLCTSELNSSDINKISNKTNVQSRL